MLGLIVLLILKVCSSNAASAIAGRTTTLTCPVPGTSYIWQLDQKSGWLTLQKGTKYDNVNTALLTIYNVELNDGGNYRCEVGSQLHHIYLHVKVNGNWGSWGDWTQCTKTCGGGTRTRRRACDNPSPVNDGSSCLGLENEIGSCSTTIPCPVNGNWGSWGDWTQCTETCGGGTRIRHRACDNPAPANGGSSCLGLENEIGSCSTTIPCQVNGNWGTWQDWNSCSLTCGIGSKSRYQECNNPQPAHGGSECQGNDTEIESCSIRLCPVASEEDNSSTTIGIGAGIGSTAVVAGLFIIFIYILKRYRLGQSVESAIYATARDTGSSNSDLHIYTGLQHNTESPTIRQKEVTYVNMVI